MDVIALHRAGFFQDFAPGGNGCLGEFGSRISAACLKAPPFERGAFRRAAEQMATMLRLDPQRGTIGLVNRQGGESSYGADHVCPPSASQEDIFRLGAAL